MQQKEKNGIVWFEFDQLQPYPHIRHAIFSRSAGDLSRLENRQSAFDAIHMPGSVRPIYPNQVHGDAVGVVTPDTHLDQPYDALISNATNQALCIQHADCQAALFYDPINECIAAVHSGWRGSCQNIYKNTIEAMRDQFGSCPKDILVCISPSLGPQNAEFIHFEKELPPAFWQFQVEPTYFDFWQISKWQLEKAGIKPSHIEIAKICTYEQEELFFSYRRERQKERNLSLIYKSSFQLPNLGYTQTT